MNVGEKHDDPGFLWILDDHDSNLGFLSDCIVYEILSTNDNWQSIWTPILLKWLTSSN